MGKLTPRVQHPDIFACFQHMLVFSLLIFFYGTRIFAVISAAKMVDLVWSAFRKYLV